MNIRGILVLLYWPLCLAALLSPLWANLGDPRGLQEEAIILFSFILGGFIAIFILTSIMVVASIFYKKHPTISTVIIAIIWTITLPCIYLYIGIFFWGFNFLV